ncbi:MAG: hypothetical protein ABIE94_02375 [archaeon]
MTQTFLAKGKRGLVYLDDGGKFKTVLKKPNPQSTAIYRLENEANFLKKLNPQGIGPKLVAEGDNEIRMKYIDGPRILDYFNQADKKKILSVIREVFRQLRYMDELGINKKEMTNPYKHIIISSGKPVMIDFERCVYSEKPQNVTQFCQFMVREKTKLILVDKGINIGRKKLLELAKAYKGKPNTVNYTRILKVFT